MSPAVRPVTREGRAQLNARDPLGNDHADQETSADAPPIEDLFEFDEDPVDFMSAESFPASDPAPPQSEHD